MSHLDRIVKRAEFVGDLRFAVLFLDLDRFKIINDSLGHLIGDKLLISFSERLESCVRPGDIVARLGGDEFTVLLNDLEDPEDAVRVAERLSQCLTKPFKIDEYEVFTSASIGIVVSDDVKRQPEDYLRDADTAMYRAKEAGKARYEIFNSKMHIRNMTLLKIENDLRRAIERNEFRVFYQPIVSLETGEIREFEALIRWQHPEHGLVEPFEFIEVAEETGLIIPIGTWIIEEACRQNMRWQKRFPQSRGFMMSVNLSAKQLLHPQLLSRIREILTRTRMKPSRLRLEVTESVVMGNSEQSLEVLNSLKKLGVSLSTDDFGTGFSSLSYLHRFPFDALKIDRSFIGQMDSNVKSAEIVRTILMLAHNLNLEAVAEGIESELQLKQLQILGCKLGQGYLFAKPLETRAVEQLVLQKSTEFLNFIPYELTRDIIESSEIH
jgi:diguanylate cyclase (GGDEF)-like protein